MNAPYNHWFRFKLPPDNRGYRQATLYGFDHGHILDCGREDCPKCQLWRGAIPFIDFEQPVEMSPITDIILADTLGSVTELTRKRSLRKAS